MFSDAKFTFICAKTQHKIKNMIKYVIFDLDGTLLDTMEDIAGACNHALKCCGCPAREIGEYNQFIGSGIYNLFRRALPEDRRDEETVMMMHKHFIPYYNDHICDRTKPYEGICDMLDRLSEQGIRFAVASNKYQEGTEKLVQKFFARYGFVSILGQKDGFPIKPDPLIIIEAMKSMPGIEKDEIIYCGDSDVDMQTGIDAGVRTIGVTWGFRSREELSAYGPWLLAGSPEEISRAILAEK